MYVSNNKLFKLLIVHGKKKQHLQEKTVIRSTSVSKKAD